MKTKNEIIKAIEVISDNLAQLQALLTLTYGNPREGFNELTEDTKNDYMWTCFSLSENIKEGLTSLEQATINL